MIAYTERKMPTYSTIIVASSTIYIYNLNFCTRFLQLKEKKIVAS